MILVPAWSAVASSGTLAASSMLPEMANVLNPITDHHQSFLGTTAAVRGVFLRTAVVVVVVVLVVFFGLAPLVLATVGQILAACCAGSSSTDTTTTTTRSALCVGRVWHTRFLPVRHAFQYPLFLFCLDLQEVEQGGLWSTRQWWPLSFLVSFHERDHLKNGEGLLVDRSGDDNEDERRSTTTTTASSSSSRRNCLSERLYRLVKERTQGRFQPTAETHRIFLVTHLRYYGYNFNPVSFYILKEKNDHDDEERICAVVGEVSNTPWNEMHCYVLHPDSVDQVQVVVPVNDDHRQEEPIHQQQEKEKHAEKLQYVFPKQFHVSPFMEMHYDYEWIFWNFSTTEPHSTIRIINNLRSQHTSTSKNALQFSAKMVVQRYSMNPYRVAWQISTFPVYCAMIQLWIHWEALRLLIKGVAFQPHPAGTETAASRWIGRFMQPYFVAQAWWERNKRSRSARQFSSDDTKKDE